MIGAEMDRVTAMASDWPIALTCEGVAGMETIPVRLASLGTSYQLPAESAGFGGAKSDLALQSMHCVIGRVNDMPTLPTGEEGDSMKTMRGRVPSLGAPYQLPVESAGFGSAKGFGIADRCIALSVGYTTCRPYQRVKEATAWRRWGAKSLRSTHKVLGGQNAGPRSVLVGLRSLRDLGPPYTLTTGN